MYEVNENYTSSADSCTNVRFSFVFGFSFQLRSFLMKSGRNAESAGQANGWIIPSNKTLSMSSSAWLASSLTIPVSHYLHHR